MLVVSAAQKTNNLNLSRGDGNLAAVKNPSNFE
jgi:hypothetical protein